MTQRTKANIGFSLAIAGLVVASFGFAVLVFVAGCAPKPAPVVDHTPTVTAPLAVVQTEHAAITTEHAAARSDLATADKLTESIPPANAAVKSADGHVAAAESHNANASKSTTTATTAAVEAGKADVLVQEALQKEITERQAHENDWLGPRAHHWIGLLIGGGVLFGLSYIVLSILAATHPNAGGIVQWLLVAGTFCVHGVVYVFVWIGHFFRHGEATSLASNVTTPVKTVEAVPVVTNTPMPVVIVPKGA